MSVESEAVAQAVLSEVNERQQRLTAQAEAVTAFSQVLVDGIEADPVAAGTILNTFYSRLETLDTDATAELAEHFQAVSKILGGRAVTESEAVSVEPVAAELATANGHETDVHLELFRANGHDGTNGAELEHSADLEAASSTNGNASHDTEAADPEAMEETISEHSAKLFSDFFGEDMFGALQHMTKAKALVVTNQLAAKLKEINAFRGPVDERLLQMVPAMVEGVSWKEIAETYYKSHSWAYVNHRNAVSSFTSHFAALDRSNMLADFWYGEARVAQSVESELAEIQAVPASTVEPEVPEPIVETEPEPVAPKPYRQEINYDAPTLEVIGQLLGYTEQKYFRALEAVFSMDRNQPNQSEQGRQVYQDFASMLDMTANSSKWFDKHGKLEYTILNAILRGAKDGKSPLSAPSVKGKFGKELGEASRKFDEVLESALQKFIEIRRQKLESAGSVVVR